MIVTLLAVAAAVAAFLAAAIPPLAAQTTALAAELPKYLHSLQDHSSQLGKLDARYHIQQRLTKLVSSRGSSLIGGVLGAGELVLGAASSLLIVAVLAIYFLADMPRIKLFAYRLAPHSRRTRVILIGDEIFAKVGGFVLGNFLTSIVAGLGTYLWMLAFGLPYPILLGLFVAFMDLIPVIGSTIGGAVVTLVALTVSLPVAAAHPRLLHRLPAGRGLPAGAQGHGQDGPGARRGLGRRGPGRRHADGHRRRARRDPGGGGTPAAA